MYTVLLVIHSHIYLIPDIYGVLIAFTALVIGRILEVSQPLQAHLCPETRL